MFSISEIMTTELYTLKPDDSLEDARCLMAEKGIRHIPIVDSDEKLLGVVTQRDVLSAADSTLLSDPATTDNKESYVALSEIMTSKILTVDKDVSLRGTAMQLQKHKIGCLPVVHKGKLLGLVTDSDFVTVSINLIEQLEMTESEGMDIDE